MPKSGWKHYALARANPVFSTDEKRIRRENTVFDKSKGGLGRLLYTIVDGARTGRRSRKLNRGSSMYPPAYAQVGARTVLRPRNGALCVLGRDA